MKTSKARYFFNSSRYSWLTLYHVYFWLKPYIQHLKMLTLFWLRYWKTLEIYYGRTLNCLENASLWQLHRSPRLHNQPPATTPPYLLLEVRRLLASTSRSCRLCPKVALDNLGWQANRPERLPPKILSHLAKPNWPSLLNPNHQMVETALETMAR